MFLQEYKTLYFDITSFDSFEYLYIINLHCINATNMQLIKSKIGNNKLLIIYEDTSIKQSLKFKEELNKIASNIQHLRETLNNNFDILISTQNNGFRLPQTYIWDFYCGHQHIINTAESHNITYIGNDEKDLKFAMNCGIPFKQIDELLTNRGNSIVIKNTFDNVGYEIGERKYQLEENVIYLMIGPPSSGKTTVLKNITTPFIHLKKDTISSRQHIIKELMKVINSDGIVKQKGRSSNSDGIVKQKGSSIIIEDYLPNIESRKIYIDICKKYQKAIVGLVFEYDIELIKHLNKLKMFEIKCNDEIINQYYKHYKPPTTNEGFSSIISIPFLIEKQNVNNFMKLL